MNIYIGDGSKIRTRIRNQHCGGNVEGSSLRKHIAKAMGYTLTRFQRTNGSWKVRLELPDPLIGEQQITDYLRNGSWKYVICPPQISAKDFQFYAIQNIFPPPILNINQGEWQEHMLPLYQNMLEQLLNCPTHNNIETINIPNESGVYLFLHDNHPNNSSDNSV